VRQNRDLGVHGLRDFRKAPSSCRPAGRLARPTACSATSNAHQGEGSAVRPASGSGDPRKIFRRCDVESRCQIDFRQSIFIDAGRSPFDAGDWPVHTDVNTCPNWRLPTTSAHGGSERGNKRTIRSVQRSRAKPCPHRRSRGSPSGEIKRRSYRIAWPKKHLGPGRSR
jgi:hypothetical protein